MSDTTKGGLPAVRAQARDRARRREAQAVELRIAGHTFAQIAATVGYSNAGAAYKAVQRALAVEADAQSQGRKTLREEQNAKLNRLLAATWSAAMKGDVKAIGQARQLLERQARLLGLDEPTNVRMSVDLDPEIEALLQDLGVDLPPPPE